MYTNYIKGYDKTMAIFQDNYQKMPKFAALVKENEVGLFKTLVCGIARGAPSETAGLHLSSVHVYFSVGNTRGGGTYHTVGTGICRPYGWVLAVKFSKQRYHFHEISHIGGWVIG